VLLLQAVAAILLMFGSLLVLKAFALAEPERRPARSSTPRLRVVSSKPRKARSRKPATELPRAA
jgi:hypothetical protein